MAEISVGSVSVDVVPNVQRFARDARDKLDPQAKDLGDELGNVMGRAISHALGDVVARGLRGNNARGTADVEGARTGKEFGDAFSRTAKAKISAALKDLPDAKIDLDAGEADAKIAFMREQLHAIKENIRLEVDDAEAIAKLEELKLFMEHELRDASSIRMRVDISAALAKVAALTAVIDAANAQAAALSGIEGAGGGGVGGGAQGAAGSASGGFPALIETGPAGLSLLTVGILALIALAPALVVAAGVISAAILGIVAALSTATLGFGAFVTAGVLVFKNFLSGSGDYQTAVKAQQKAQQAFDKAQISAEFSLGFDKGGAKAPGAAAAALALAQKQGLGTKFLPSDLKPGQKASLALAGANLQTANQGLATSKAALGPSGVALSNQWQALLAQFDTTTSQLAPLVYPAMSAGIRLIGSALQYLAPIVKAVSPVIVGLLDQAGRALTSPAAKTFTDFIITNAPKLIGSLGRLIGGIFGFLVGFIEKFTPLGTSILNWLGQASGKIANFFKSENFTFFLSEVKHYAPVVGQFLGATLHLVGNLLAALAQLAPVGAIMLKGLSLAFEALGPILRVVADSIDAVFLGILHALGFVLHAFAAVAHFLHLPFANALDSAATSVDNFTNDFQTQVDAINAALGGTLTAVNQLAKPHKITFSSNLAALIGPNAVLGNGSHFPVSVGVAAKLAGLSAKAARGNSTGGLVTGQGTSTSDSIPRWLSNGEYVVKSASVARYGTDMMRAVNDGTYQPTHQRVLHVEATGYGANEVADAIVRKDQAHQLLYGRR